MPSETIAQFLHARLALGCDFFANRDCWCCQSAKRYTEHTQLPDRIAGAAPFYRLDYVFPDFKIEAAHARKRGSSI